MNTAPYTEGSGTGVICKDCQFVAEGEYPVKTIRLRLSEPGSVAE
jgi:hypothetical protein